MNERIRDNLYINKYT